MDVLIDDDALAALEAQLARPQGTDRVELSIALAWHLRQRDSARALALVAEAEARLPDDAHARLTLIRGEIRLLFADFDRAHDLAAAALVGFIASDDAAGCCDTWWLMARLATDRGDVAARDEALRQARRFAERCDDPLRADLMATLVACHAVFSDAAQAESDWGATVSAQLAAGHPALTTWACDFRACVALDRSDHAEAITWLRKELDAAHRSGQIKKAIATAANIGLAFSRLNDHGTALEWAGQALALARRAGWPASLGVSLLQTAAALDQLERPDAAADMVAEALAVLAPLTGSFNYLLALVHQGELALKRGDPQSALSAFAELDARTRTENHLNFRVSVLLGTARALAETGQPEAAAAAAAQALATAVAGRHSNFEIDALRVLAELYARFELLSTPDQLTGPSAALQCLDRAFATATGLPGYTLPSELLAFAAELHARVGNPVQAYALSLQASAARDATHGRDARNRAIAMQVRHDTERARADSEHHRQLAAVETRRAEALSEALAALERLTAERDETLAFLAHDLRAPLAAIVALLPDADGADTSLLPKAARFAGRALSLTDGFLAMARLGGLRTDARVRLDLASVVDEASETFLQRAFDEGKTLATTLAFGIAVDGHREALLRAFCNLIDNALRFTPEAGLVAVEMRCRDASVEVSVTDSGPGLPPEAQAVLRSGGAASRGRMGLAIVAEVARLHQAMVTVSATTTGTRIALQFATDG